MCVGFAQAFSFRLSIWTRETNLLPMDSQDPLMSVIPAVVRALRSTLFKVHAISWLLGLNKKQKRI
jgi:hypothetical protein